MSLGPSGGGGGSSGITDYPPYMKTMHESWLTALNGYLTTALSSNPYATSEVYDMTSDLNSFLDSYNILSDRLTTFNELTDFDSISAAVSKVLQHEEILADDGRISEVVNNYSKRQNRSMLSNLGKFKASMTSGGNKVFGSSTLALGEAIFRNIVTDNVADFDAKVSLDSNNKKMDLYAAMVSFVMEQKKYRMELYKALHVSYADYIRTKIQDFTNKYAGDLEIALREATYELGLYAFGGNLLAAISGATIQKWQDHQQEKPAWMSFLSAGLSAASLITGLL